MGELVQGQGDKESSGNPAAGIDHKLGFLFFLKFFRVTVTAPQSTLNMTHTDGKFPGTGGPGGQGNCRKKGKDGVPALIVCLKNILPACKRQIDQSHFWWEQDLTWGGREPCVGLPAIDITHFADEKTEAQRV